MMARSRRSNGEGTITRLPDGRWQGRLRVQGRRLAVYGKSRKEVEERLRALRGQVELLGRAPERMPLSAWVTRWLEDQALRLRPRTLARYQEILDTHVLPTLGQRPLCEIRPLHIQEALKGVLARGRSPATAQRVRNLLHKVFEDARRLELLTHNPVDPVPSPPQRPPALAVWDAPTLTRFLSATAGTKWGPLWGLLAASGLRLGEAVALTWGDVNPVTGEIRVHKSITWTRPPRILAPKTAAGRRVVVLPSWGRAVLEALWQRARQRLGRDPKGDDLLFPGPDGGLLHYEAVRSAWRRALRRTGLSGRIHDLRHAFASYLVRGGLDLKVVASLLGHADGGVLALKTYAHTLGAPERAVEVLDKALAAALPAGDDRYSGGVSGPGRPTTGGSAMSPQDSAPHRPEVAAPED